MNIDNLVHEILLEGLSGVDRFSLPKLFQHPSLIEGMVKYYEHRREAKINPEFYAEIHEKIKSELAKIISG